MFTKRQINFWGGFTIFFNSMPSNRRDCSWFEQFATEKRYDYKMYKYIANSPLALQLLDEKNNRPKSNCNNIFHCVVCLICKCVPFKCAFSLTSAYVHIAFSEFMLQLKNPNSIRHKNTMFWWRALLKINYWVFKIIVH